MSLATHYKKAVLVPSLLLVVGIVLDVIYDNMFGPEYKSEWMTKEGLGLIAIGLISGHSLLVCALSAALFLNKYEKVRKSFVLSLLAWFLLPGSYLVSILFKHFNYLLHHPENTGESIFVVMICIPYLIGLSATFYNFRKKLTN